MGRKRNQGKARRAAKAKAREEAGERENNNLSITDGPEQSLSAQMRQLQMSGKCRHGFDPVVSIDDFPIEKFVRAFRSSFSDVVEVGGLSLAGCLVAAGKATVDEFTDVWRDSATMEIAISCFLCMGTYSLVEGNVSIARDLATFVRYLEQYTAIEFKQTQAIPNWPKIGDTYEADLHTLVSFLRHRIPCSCLDEKYEEVKHITKTGLCWNPQCSIRDRKVERSKAKYCSRCRCVTYCSRECQEADWSGHKSVCDYNAAVIAEFEAEMTEKQATLLHR